MMGTSQSAARGHDDRSGYLVAGFVLLLVVLCGLVYYKWGGAIRTVSGVRELGRWSGTADGLTTGGVLRATLFYFRRIWIALAYGLLIGAAVRAFVPPRHRSARDRKSTRLNSSHRTISYAVFCLKKKKKRTTQKRKQTQTR